MTSLPARSPQLCRPSMSALGSQNVDRQCRPSSCVCRAFNRVLSLCV